MDNDRALADMLAELAASLEGADRTADPEGRCAAAGSRRLADGPPGFEASPPCAG